VSGSGAICSARAWRTPCTRTVWGRPGPRGISDRSWASDGI